MNKLTTGVSAVLLAAIAVACRLESIVDSPEYYSGSQEVGRLTYEAAWVGFFQGTGSAELLDTGDSYSDLPVCIQTWVEAGRLRGAVHMPLGAAASDALVAISDRDYSWYQDGVCAGIGVTMTAWCSTEEVTSKDWLLLSGVHYSSSNGSTLQLSLRIDRHGETLVGLLEIERAERWDRPHSNSSIVARFSLHVDRAN